MNREIKFRVWDTEEKQMYFSEFGIEHHCCGWTPWAFPECDYQHIEHKRIMQYTGAHDKEGREIYEGDLLKVIDPDNDLHIAHTQYGDVFEVSFDEHDLRFTIGCTRNYLIGRDLCIADSDKFEIVGNIYEHAELLANK